MAEGVIATGTRIVFETTGWSGFVVNIAEDGSGRGVIDTTHLLSTPPGANQRGGRTKIPTTLGNPGTWTFTVNHVPGNEPPLHEPEEFVRIEYPLPAGLTVPAQSRGLAFATNFNRTFATEELIQGTLVIELTGVWEDTDAS